jgi:MFS transporter, ACS family, D-galactonate transporter
MPFGWFADKADARVSLLIAVVWWSIFTALTAAARNVATFLGCRLLLGIGDAGAYPSCAKVTAVWFPRSERGLTSGLIDGRSRIGSALSILRVSWLIRS